MKALSQKELRQRKLLMALPILTLPFIVMIFWALGGGQLADAQSTQKQLNGLATQLPGLQKEEDKNADKLSFYQDAEKDSATWRDQLRNDPYYHDTAAATAATASLGLQGFGNSSTSGGTLSNYTDPNEAKVNLKLEQLYQQLNNAQGNTASNVPGNSQAADETERMTNLLRSMNSQNAPDQDMQQLSTMLDKILYIEHPEMARDKIREQSLKNKRQVFTVSTLHRESGIQLMEGSPQSSLAYNSYDVVAKAKNGKYGNRKVSYPIAQPNSFYEWGNIAGKEDSAGNTIEAVVAETRTLITASTIKLKLLNDIFINGQMIPKGEFIYGTCSISGDRLLISLSTIRYHNSIYPVELAAYDMDGIAGINMPDAISRQVAKGSASQAINGIDVFAYDNTLKGQAISTGVQAAKGLFSKKTQLIRVTVREGYQILLRNTNEQ